MEEANISVKILSENIETAFNGRKNTFDFSDGFRGEIGQHKGPAVIYISCVSSTPDNCGRFKTHPNLLVGKEDCNVFDGVCKVKLKEGCNVFEVDSIGVRCPHNDDVPNILKARYKRGIDPYKGKI